MRLRAMCGFLLLVPLVVLGIGPALNAHSAEQYAPPTACSTQTGKCARGLLYAYWTENGGVERNGYPITDDFDEQGTDGTMHRVQYFERSRFEYHQEAINTPGVIQSGLLGVEAFKARYPQGQAGGNSGGQCFTETNRCIIGGIKGYWERNGGTAAFGLPISDELDEKGEDGGTMRHVQYFERVRLEYHADRAGMPDEITLGLLGTERFGTRYPQGQPPTSPEPPINIWANLRGPIDPKIANLPPRVYVPDEIRGDITVIDPKTFTVIDRYPVGKTSHHVGPSPDFSHLYVNNMGSSTLTEIDVQTGKPTRNIAAAVPYNLYFTTDGTKGIVAAEPQNSLDFFDAQSWNLIKRVPIPCSGVDHADMSADGKYMLIGCEFSGHVFKVDVVNMRILGSVQVGGQPIDIKLSPDGSVFFVANQTRNGVSVIDPVAMREIAFLATDRGAHGFAVSRDTNSLYVANRLAGTISVLDFSRREITQTWRIGGSPDMLVVSPDGTELWASGRFDGVCYVIDTRTGQLAQRIVTGTAPHGLTYWPLPGKISIGHNGVLR